MAFDFDHARNPFLKPSGGRIGVRDSALHYHDGVLRCFFTASYWNGETFRSQIQSVQTTDLVTWTQPTPIFTNPPTFWSVGNVLFVDGCWVMCMQSYPIEPFHSYAGEESRLWISRSPDLSRWQTPVSMNPQGARLRWTDSRRQIDPFFIRHLDQYWCFYKCSGSLSALVSTDLSAWREASPDRPLLSRNDTPDNVNVENPCILRHGDEFVLFFSACRDPHAIGTARSTDLLHWRDVRYLEFPSRPWMPQGPNGAMTIDLRAECGKWLMVLHADWSLMPHSGFLALAWSEDLEHWTCP